jgi:O-antigen/teichoic acid export membrane protein
MSEASESTIPMAEGPSAAPAAPGFGSRLRRLGAESLVYGLSSIVGRFLSYLLQPYYAHAFTPAQNGVQGAVYTFIPLASILFLLGMDVAYMRSAASVRDAELTQRQRAFSMPFASVLVAGGAGVLLGILATPWIAPALGLPPYAVRYLFAIVYTDGLLAVPYAHLRMTNRSLQYALLRLLFVGLSLAMNIGLIAGAKWGVEAIFLANFASNLVVLLLFIPTIAKLFRPGLLRGSHWKPLWAYALPLIPATLAVMLVENGDRVVLNFISPATARSVYGMASKDAVLGIYNFNYKLGVAMLLVVQMFRMAWTPFSLTHARQPDAPLLFSRVLTALSLFCTGVLLAIAFFLPPLVAIPAVRHYPSSPAFWVGLPIVPIILLGYVFSGIYAVVTIGLYVERRTGALPWIAGAGAVVNIIWCVIAARSWGMVGVAWATPIAYGLMAALGARSAGRVYPVPYEWGRLARIGAIAGALFAADQLLSPRLGTSSGAALGAKVALLFAFPAILAITGFFRAGEVQAMRGVLRRFRRRPASA